MADAHEVPRSRSKAVLLCLIVVMLAGAACADGQARARSRPRPRCAAPKHVKHKQRRKRSCRVSKRSKPKATHAKAPVKPTPPKSSVPPGSPILAAAPDAAPPPATGAGTATNPLAPPPSDGAGIGASGWTPLREPGVGGRISGLAVNPSNPADIVVGGDMLGIGVSQDGGLSWQTTSGLSSWEVNAFTWDASDPHVVWVGTLSGPYESVDGGHTWSGKRVGLPPGDYPYSAPVQKVLIDSTNPEHLLAFGGNQSQFKAGGTGALNYGLVYQSLDGGGHWSTIASIGTNWNILDVVAGSGDLQTLYAAVLAHGVYKSSDGGRTWSPTDTGLPNSQAMALAGDPGDPDTVWAAIGHDPTTTGGVYRPGGIYETTDGGQRWAARNDGIPQNANGSASYATSMASILRAGDGTLYTADQGWSDQNRYVSTDGGAHWTQAGAGFARAYPAAATPYAWASSADGGLIIGGSSDTLMASIDHGATWHDVGSTQTANGGWHGNGFSGLLGTRIAFSPTQPGTMFLTGFDAGNLLRSTDSGASWTRPLAGWDNYGGGYDLQVGGRTGQVLYEVLGQAGVFNGIAVSRDAGQTWTYHTGGALPARYASGSGQGSIAVASSDGAVAYAVLPNQQVYVTTDTGTSWTQVSLGSPAFAVASSPTHGSTYIATNAGIFQIDGAGDIPTLIGGSPAGLRRLVVASDGAVYGAGPIESSESGLWTNKSETWTRLSGNQWVNDVAIDPANPRRIVYVTNDNPYHDTSFATGVWISCDAGQTFKQYNDGLPMLRVLSVGFDPWTPGRVVIGTDGRGYWQAQLAPCTT